MESHLTYCKLALDSPCGNPRVSFTLWVNDKFAWVLLVGGYQILPSDSALLSDLPSCLVTGMYTVFSCTMCRALVTFPHVFTTVSGVVKVLEKVDSLKVCSGNAEILQFAEFSQRDVFSRYTLLSSTFSSLKSSMLLFNRGNQNCYCGAQYPWPLNDTSQQM